jgi:SAM-dependent methyltransferase
LVPNKAGVFKEIFRVMKPGGHFSISDVVLVGDLPEALTKDMEMYAGCVAGAIQKNDYLQLIQASGFQNITLQKEKVITIPDDILQRYMSAEETNEFKAIGTGIFSVTVYAEKPQEQAACCAPGCCN